MCRVEPCSNDPHPNTRKEFQCRERPQQAKQPKGLQTQVIASGGHINPRHNHHHKINNVPQGIEIRLVTQEQASSYCLQKELQPVKEHEMPSYPPRQPPAAVPPYVKTMVVEMSTPSQKGDCDSSLPSAKPAEAKMMQPSTNTRAMGWYTMSMLQRRMHDRAVNKPQERPSMVKGRRVRPHFLRTREQRRLHRPDWYFARKELLMALGTEAPPHSGISLQGKRHVI